jgi:hypothetical protein
MAVTHPTVSRNYLADAHDDYVNTGAGTAVLRLRDGTTTLGDFDLANPAFGAAAAGVITLASTPIAATASGTGTADNYQVINRNGDIAHAGSVTISGGGGDVTADNPSIVSGQGLSLDSFTYTAAS